MTPKRQPHPQHLWANVIKPPNDRVRIEMFLDAADRYSNLASTFALPNIFGQETQPVSDEDYWVLMMHASLLRKFFASEDQVEVVKVVASAEALMPNKDEAFTAQLRAFSVEPTDVPQLHERRLMGIPIPSWEMVIIELYGRHLHSDFGKFHAAERLLNRIHYPDMWAWCVGAATVVLGLTESIRDGDRRGLLDLEDDMQPYF